MIEANHQINDVERRVGTRVLAAGEARTMTISQRFRTGIDDLWDACTNPDRIPRWFVPVTGDLSLGGRYQIEGNASGTIERCDPPKSFAATWEFGQQVSWIEVWLTPEPDGWTSLEVQHIAHVDDDLWDQFGPGAVGIGWDMIFLGLASHVTDGGPPPTGAPPPTQAVPRERGRCLHGRSAARRASPSRARRSQRLISRRGRRSRRRGHRRPGPGGPPTPRRRPRDHRSPRR